MESKLTIREVSEKMKVSKHTLRFWEKELEGIFVPLRTRGGQRRYTNENLYIIMKIKMLKNKGKSLAEIKDELIQNNKINLEDRPVDKIEALANEVAEVVRSAVYDYLQGVKENNIKM